MFSLHIQAYIHKEFVNSAKANTKTPGAAAPGVAISLAEFRRARRNKKRIAFEILSILAWRASARAPQGTPYPGTKRAR